MRLSWTDSAISGLLTDAEDESIVDKSRRIFANVAGAALILWWTSDALGLLGAGIASQNRTASHIAAEVLLGCALLLSARLQQRKARAGRVALAGAFGGLAYASANIISGYATQPIMIGVLVSACVLSVIAVLSLMAKMD